MQDQDRCQHIWCISESIKSCFLKLFNSMANCPEVYIIKNFLSHNWNLIGNYICHYPDAMVYISKASSWEAELERSGVQGQSWLSSKFETSLSDVRLYQINYVHMYKEKAKQPSRIWAVFMYREYIYQLEYICFPPFVNVIIVITSNLLGSEVSISYMRQGDRKGTIPLGLREVHPCMTAFKYEMLLIL